jgi:hypothetical protein
MELQRSTSSLLTSSGKGRCGLLSRQRRPYKTKQRKRRAPRAFTFGVCFWSGGSGGRRSLTIKKLGVSDA